MKQNLILFTNSFPFGKGEEFLETEILFLSKEFKSIYIYPSNIKGNLREVPHNVFIKKIDFKNVFTPKKIILKYIKIFILILLYELFLSKKRFYFFKKIKFYFNTIIWKINYAEQLFFELKQYEISNTLFYTYWFDNWAFLMSVVKKMSKNRINFISRIHGYDFEPLRWKNQFIPFRYFEMNQVHQILSNSIYAKKIINKQYPFYKNISVNSLGVLDVGTNPINTTDEFHLVSCSGLTTLKRVYLIVEILKHISIKLKWTHFGDGSEIIKIKEMISLLPNHISVNLMGHTLNQDVLKFYKTNSIDLFINVSEMEGIPVSIMEAISFGIPCIGCNVGGMSEIITNQTGFLIEKEFNSFYTAKLIEEYYNKSLEYKLDFRNGAKQFWNKNFNANTNYKNLLLNF